VLGLTLESKFRLQDKNKLLVKDAKTQQHHTERVFEVLNESIAKYEDLSWYAESAPVAHLTAARTGRKTIAAKFPKEAGYLNGANQEWHKGFNAGCKAFAMLIASHQIIADAEEGASELAEADDTFATAASCP